jgi:guanylate kinase
MSQSASSQKLVVISGPSGVGKGVVCNQLLQAMPQLSWSISATTRSQRPGEEEGVNYYFLGEKDFKDRILDGAFVEWATFAGASYGTLKTEMTRLEKQGKMALLEIDTQGALQIRKKMPTALLIFIAPPSLAELERRLVVRAQNTPKDMQNRLAIAERELALQQEFDAVVVNEKIESTVEELKKLILPYLQTQNTPASSTGLQ